MRFLTLLLACGGWLMPGKAQQLVAWYPFSGHPNDASGHNIHPIYVGSGVSLTTDRFGMPNSAYYFDGQFGPTGNSTGSFIRLPADELPTGNRTVSFWFWADAVSNFPTPFSYGGNACNASCYLMVINKGNNNAYTTTGHCNAAQIDAPYTVGPVRVWKHWVQTIEGSTQKTYIDGQLLQTSNNYSGSTYVAGRHALIGALLYPDGLTAYEDNSAKTFRGMLDDIRIYDAALTAAQVQALYRREKTGLVANYLLNGNTHDQAGQAAAATVHAALQVPNRFAQAASAYQFNGTNAYLEVPDTPALRLPMAITLSAWVKRTRMGIDIIMEKGGDWTGSECNFGMGLHHLNNRMFYFFFKGGWRGTDGVQDFDWHHYAVVARQGDTNPILYIDGDEKPIRYSSGGGPIQLQASALPLHIGAQVANFSYYGANVIDEVKIYDVALGPAAIKMLSEGLLAWYPMSGHADDASGNGHDGVVQDAVLVPDRTGKPNEAYSFSGNACIVVPDDSAMFSNTFTLSYWLKVPSFYGDRVVLSWAGMGYNYQQYFSGSVFAYLIGYNSAAPPVFFSSIYMNGPWLNDTWQHVAVSYQKRSDTEVETNIYVDGTWRKRDVQGVAIRYMPGAAFLIGKNHGGISLNGALDDVRLYGRVLSEAEINALAATEFTFVGQGNWSSAANWLGGTPPTNPLPAGYRIVIDPPGDSECIVDVPLTLSAQSSLLVRPGKKMRIAQ